MAAADDDAEKERLRIHGERIAFSKDKSMHAADFQAIITALKGNRADLKRQAANYIPMFIHLFPALAPDAISAILDLVETDEVAIRKEAIQTVLLILRKERSGRWSKSASTDFYSKSANALGQLLFSEVQNLEPDVVNTALMAFVKKDVKSSLQALFKLMRERPDKREKIFCFLRDKVFPLKSQLLKPQFELERFMTDLIKISIQDASVSEFEFFMSFLQNLSLFEDSTLKESSKELIEIMETWACLDSQFNSHPSFQVSGADHIERWMSCMQMSHQFLRGGSSSKFIHFFTLQIVPAFEQISEEKKLDLLKTIGASSPYAEEQDSLRLVTSVVMLLKSYMPNKKVEDISHTSVECLLYMYHHFTHKFTGRLPDGLGDDFMERLTGTEETVRAALKRLTKEPDKETSERKKLSYSNILAMTQAFYTVEYPFSIENISPSWMEQPKKPAATTAGGESSQPGNGPTTLCRGERSQPGNAPATLSNKRRDLQNQIVSSAAQKLARGGRVSARGRGPWDAFY